MFKCAMEPENFSSVPFGIFIHFAPLAMFFGLQFMGIHFLISMMVPGTLFALIILYLERRYPNSKIPDYSYEDVLSFLIDTAVYALAVGVPVILMIRWMLDWWWPVSKPMFGGFLAALCSADVFYYILHRCLYHTLDFFSKWKMWFYRIHHPHHTVKELDTIRGSHASLVDQAILSFQVPVAFFGWLYGLDLHATLQVYASIILLQATHHANYTFDIGILRYIFMDSHSHKFHHCIGGGRVNFGVAFCLCDRLFGSYYDERERNPNSIHAKRQIFKY